MFVPLLSFAKRRPAHPWCGTSRPQRGTEGGGRAASLRPRRLLTGRRGGGEAPGSSQCVPPPPSLPDKGSAMNSPPEPNKRLLSVGSILLLYKATRSPSNTLSTAATAAKQPLRSPTGAPGTVCVSCPPPPGVSPRPSGKVTCSLVIPAGKNSRGRGAGACARGGTGRAAEPPRVRRGAKPRPPLPFLLKKKFKKAEKNPFLTQQLSRGRMRHPGGGGTRRCEPTPIGVFWGGRCRVRTPLPKAKPRGGIACTAQPWPQLGQQH